MCRYCDNIVDNDTIEYDEPDGSYTNADIEVIDGEYFMFVLVHEEGLSGNRCGALPINNCPMCGRELKIGE